MEGKLRKVLIFESLPTSERAFKGMKNDESEKSPREQTGVYPCGSTSLRSVIWISIITTILFFYWIGAVSQCALSLCNIIYDAKRPKNYSLCGSTGKCKIFATRAYWKFKNTILRQRSLIPETKVERKELYCVLTIFQEGSRRYLISRML